MYVPPHFRIDDQEVVLGAIRAHPFATLVSGSPDGPFVTHLPMMVDEGHGKEGIALLGHVARANPHWRLVAEDPRTLAIFHGPHAYVSPRFYPSKQEHGRVVPTWNYVAIHVRGRLEAFDEPDRLRDLVDRLTKVHETGAEQPWALSDAPEDYVRRQLRGIVGLALHVEAIEGKAKLSQNREAADRAGVVAGLEKGDATERAAAQWMKGSHGE